VLDIETITDLDTAKQIALLLQKENDRIHKRLDEQTRELAKLKGQDGDRQLNLEIEKLQSQMSKLQRMMFGASSEKRKGDNSNKDADKDNKAKQTGHGPKEQPELPRIPQTHKLSDEDRICDLCGGILDEWEGQFEESEEISVVERVFFIKEHKQKKYRCKCGGSVKTAKKPPRLVEGGRYSTEFAVEVAVEKYLDHMPLERQSRKMKREGLRVGSQTLWDQIWALAKLLQPTYDALLPYIFSFAVICADESIWYMLQKGGRKKWFIWGASCPFAVYYRLDPSRGGKIADELLGDFEGTIITDGYKGYSGLVRAGPGGEKSKIDLANCWAHARRKFVDCEQDYPLECKAAIDMIRELYDVESQTPDLWKVSEEDRDEVLKMILRNRTEQSRPITERIKAWAKEQLSMPQSTFRGAIEYMLGHWAGLTKFLDNPMIPLDTNQIERGFRGPAVGRKNHYGSKSKRGTEVAAIFYSLIESAKLCGVNPREYLLAAARKSIETPGAALLPHEFSKEQKS
jgi:transposase